MSDSVKAPFLRGDAIFLKHPDGAVVKDACSSYVVRGEDAYGWLSSLVGLLDGNHSLDEVLAVFPEGLRPTAQELINVLVSQETVRWVDRAVGAARHPLNALEAFLANWTDDPVGVARAFRAARVDLVGEGHDAAALVRTLGDNGVEDVHVVGTSSARGSWVVAAASATLVDLQDLAQRAEAGEFVLLPIIALNDALVLGPFLGRSYPGCLDDVLAALRRNEAAGTDGSVRQAVSGQEESDGALGHATSMVPLDLMGTHAAFELFREITGVIPSELTDSVCVMDVPSLDMHLERLVSPFAAIEQEPVTGPVTLAGVESQAPDEDPVLDSLLALKVPRTGLVSRFDDLELPQEPLFLGAVSHGWNEDRRSLGFSRENLASARREAFLAVLEDVASSRLGQLTLVAAGSSAREAEERVGWEAATRSLNERLLAASGDSVTLALPDDPLGRLETGFLAEMGLVVVLLLWPEVSDRLVVGTVRDSNGALVVSTSQAAPTAEEAATIVLDRLVAAVQAGRPEVAQRGRPTGLETVVGAQGSSTSPESIRPSQAPAAWFEVIGGTPPQVVDATPKGLAHLTPARVCAIAMSSGAILR